MELCVYPDCTEVAQKDEWCSEHWGLYPHDCEHPGCDRRPVYNDEPMCFTHSPEEGSSRKGYSAWKRARGLQ